MGDVAMCVPVIKTLTETYPDIRITFLSKPLFSAIFSDIPQVKVFHADVKEKYKGIAGLYKLSKELRDQEIDAVADLHQVLRSNILQLFFGLYGIPFKQLKKGRGEKKALTRESDKLFRQLKTTHQRYEEVFSSLRLPVDLDKFTPLKKKELWAETEEITGKKSVKWIGIAPFAAHPSKVYPAELMKEVLIKLQQMANLKIFLFGGGPGEKEILDIWEKEFTNAISMAGKIPFEQELALISQLDLMVSMDSGNGHLASNYGVPVITLWGLTHPYAGFAPFGQPRSNNLLSDREQFPLIPTSVYGKYVPVGYDDVMRSIPVERVYKRAMEILEST